jgi:HK97 family phage major capsid protein
MNTEMFNKLDEAFSGFVARSNKTLSEISDRMDHLEAKNNLLEIGSFIAGSGNENHAGCKEHRAAFLAFARKGQDQGLASLEVRAGMSVGSDPDGGYAVPIELDRQIENLLGEQSPMRRVCNVIQVKTPNYNKLVDVGGLNSGWVGETEARPATNTSQLVKLTPFWGEIYANPGATQQILDDASFDFEAFIVDGISAEFGIQEGPALVSGNGVLRPKGILAYQTAATADATRAFGTLQHVVSGDASGFKAASATVSPADCLVDLVHSLKSVYRPGAIFMMNRGTLATIAKFKSATDGLPVWTRSLAEGQPSTLLGHPVIENDDFPDVGAGAYPIAFGNFRRGYTITDRNGTRILRDPYSAKPHVHFYGTRRVGSFLNNSQAIKLLKISA